MIESIKKLIKKLPFALTKNHHYDLVTQKIISEYLNEDSCCVDVGCYKGEIMDLMLDAAPDGTHYGFEPVPDQFSFLKNKYQNNPNVIIVNVALKDENGTSTFNFVKSNPPYSGLIKRDYDRKEEVDEIINVETKCLDDTLAIEHKIDLIKIDVEGGEYEVLLGAEKMIEQNRPIVIFEFGLGAADHYGTTPDMIFDYFRKFNMRIFVMKNFINDKEPLSLEQFKSQFYDRLNYYFVAHM